MAKRKKQKKKMRGERVEGEKNNTSCCVCGSSDQNCRECKCVQAKKACMNCRRGAECQNKYGNKTSESIDVNNNELNEKTDENQSESQGPTRRSKRQEDQKKKRKA